MNHSIIKTRAELKDWIAYEKKRANARDGLYYLLQVRENEILYRHVRLLRYTEFHKNSGHKIRFMISFFRLLRIQNRYSIHVPLNACGRGFKIMHLGPVLINGTAQIGEDCTMHVNTGLVAGGVSNDAPVIGNRVVVGIGAIVLGGITVADGVAIGANAVVSRDVIEQDITVAGAPAKKISDHGTALWNLPPVEHIEKS